MTRLPSLLNFPTAYATQHNAPHGLKQTTSPSTFEVTTSWANDTNSLLWWKTYLLWWQNHNFVLVVLPWALLTNKWYYYPDDLINLGIPARLQSGYDSFSDMLADWFSCPCFFPFLLSKAPLDPIETLISKVADYLMYWKNSSVENWMEKTTTTPNYATWNTNELFSVHALANAMSRFRLEFGVNKHL